MSDDEIRFEWDPVKNASNQKKHGVSFEEGKAVFLDENGKYMPDPEHSSDEERFLLLGISYTTRILVVCHCEREEGRIIRIISARKATKNEEKQYWG